MEVERTVDAPMERVWALLRDYRIARPRLLSEHFSDYGVRDRGEGAGTVIAYRLRVGRHQAQHVVDVGLPHLVLLPRCVSLLIVFPHQELRRVTPIVDPGFGSPPRVGSLT